MEKAITLEQAEAFDMDAYFLKERKKSEKVINAAVKFINSIIPPMLPDIKKIDEGVWIGSYGIPKNGSREWHIIQQTFEVSGFYLSRSSHSPDVRVSLKRNE